MIYCINPECKQRQNPDELESCQFCGTPLLINSQYRLIEPLRRLDRYDTTEVFEIDDNGVRKVMKILKSDDPKLIELMEREVHVLQYVDSPGIPLVDIDGYFDFTLKGDSSKIHCLVMEKIPGHNLEDWIELNGPISQALAIEWLEQILRILDTLHSYNFFHRDIKPTNIILRPDGKLALIDFGGVREVTNTYMAKVSTGLSKSTIGGALLNVTVIRTACYTPYEQVNGKAVPQSDFFALGRTFVYLLTGTPLLDIPNDRENGKLLWREKAPDVDEPFADLIDELMAFAPGKRPQNTQIILQRLKQLPLQVRWNRIFKSSFFRTGAIALVLFVSWGLANGLLLLAANYYFEQGVKAQKANNVELAKRDFEQAASWNPRLNLPISGFYFDQASRNGSNLEFARKNYEMAIKFNSNDVDAYNNLALVCQNLNDLNCAESTYKKALGLKHNYWEGYFNLGNFYDDLGNYTVAEEQYNLAKQPNGELYIKAINNLSRLQNIKGEYDRAVKLAIKGLERTHNPKIQASLYKNLGWARLKQNRYSDANFALQTAQILDPARTDTYCLLAQAESAQHDNSNAAIDWDTCLRKNSNQPEVLQWRDQKLRHLLRGHL